MHSPEGLPAEDEWAMLSSFTTVLMLVKQSGQQGLTAVLHKPSRMSDMQY